MAHRLGEVGDRGMRRARSAGASMLTMNRAMLKIAHAQLEADDSQRDRRAPLVRSRPVQRAPCTSGQHPAAACRERAERSARSPRSVRPSADRPATSSSAPPAPAPARRRRSRRCGSRTDRPPTAIRPESLVGDIDAPGVDRDVLRRRGQRRDHRENREGADVRRGIGRGEAGEGQRSCTPWHSTIQLLRRPIRSSTGACSRSTSGDHRNLKRSRDRSTTARRWSQG